MAHEGNMKLAKGKASYFLKIIFIISQLIFQRLGPMCGEDSGGGEG